MAACCGPKRVSRPVPLQVACPSCSDPGRTVNNITVRSLVHAEVRGRVGEGDYNLCLNPGCEVVYYDGSHPPLTRAEMAVPIGFKLREGRKLICYCFDLTADDVIAEMRRNPRARSFPEVASIFGMNDCRCELNHPFGGHCACAAEVGRAVKDGLRDPLVLAVEQRRSAMRKVHIFEQAGDGGARSASLAAFLERKYGEDLEVRSFAVDQSARRLPAPAALLRRMCQEGSRCLPALVIDDEVVSAGSLPDMMTAVELIDRALPTN